MPESPQYRFAPRSQHRARARAIGHRVDHLAFGIFPDLQMPSPAARGGGQRLSS